MDLFLQDKAAWVSREVVGFDLSILTWAPDSDAVSVFSQENMNHRVILTEIIYFRKAVKYYGKMEMPKKEHWGHTQQQEGAIVLGLREQSEWVGGRKEVGGGGH